VDERRDGAASTVKIAYIVQDNGTGLLIGPT
jgi:hypothetical protein